MVALGPNAEHQTAPSVHPFGMKQPSSESPPAEEGLLEPPNRELSLEEALEEVGRSPTGGLGRFSQRMIWVCGAGWWADNAWLNAVILIEAPVQIEFQLTNGQSSFLLTTLFIGEIAGAALWGPASDRIGRKLAFVASLAIAGVVGLAASCAPSFRLLLLLLLLVGVGVGGNLPVDGALFAELVPGSQRGRLLILLSAFWSLGQFSVSLLAWLLIPPHSCHADADCAMQDNMGWRMVIAVVAMLNLIALATRIGMPESPAFLLKNGRKAEAAAVLDLMAAENNHPSWGGVTLIETGDKCPERAPVCVRLREDLRKLNHTKHATLTVCLLALIWFFSTLGMGLFTPIVPRLLARKGISSSSHIYRDLLINATPGIPACLLAAWLVETRLGRLKTMAIGGLITAASLAAFNLVSDETSVIIANACISFAVQPMFAALYLYTPEVIPTEVRGTIVAWLAGLGRVSGTVAPSMASLFLDNGLETVLWCVCFTSIGVTVLSAMLLPIETRGRHMD